jgi:hypothetical protein
VLVTVICVRLLPYLISRARKPSCNDQSIPASLTCPPGEAVVTAPRLWVELNAAERASYNGSIEASQASDVGSIPIARSN